MPKVELANYEGREQAYVKHCLLENYLSDWSYKIGSAWDSLVYVDGFAGPWGAKDEVFGDASFGIAVRVMKASVHGLWEKRNKAVRGLCIFVEKRPDAFAKLDAFAKSASTQSVRAVALKGRFVKKLPEIGKLIAESGKKPFKFVFLDQKGWAAVPMLELQPFVAERSCEVMFNLMTSFLTRFVDTTTRADSYHNLFGRAGVLDRIRSLPKGTGEREEAAVREYCKSLRDICGFRYVAEAVILKPGKEKILYYLVFATNNHRGIEVFKNAEMAAARTQDDIRHETKLRKTKQEEMLFDGVSPKSPKIQEMRAHYLARARLKIVETLIAGSTQNGVDYEKLYCEAMAFPLVTPSDLENWLREFEPHIRLHLEGTQKRRKPQPDKNDRIFVLNKNALQ